MKNPLPLVLLVLLVMGCNLSDDHVLFQEKPDTFPGQWVLVETSYSTGAELEYNEVKNGGFYKFQPDGTFTSVQLDACGRGTYKLEDGKLILTYDCDTKDNPNPFIFGIAFKENYFILSPISIACIEGCPSKYKKSIK